MLWLNADLARPSHKDILIGSKELKTEWGADMVDVKHPKYGEKLLKTTVRINGKHI